MAKKCKTSPYFKVYKQWRDSRRDTPASRLLCKDGPLRGEALMLTTGETAVISIRGQTGYYNASGWWVAGMRAA